MAESRKLHTVFLRIAAALLVLVMLSTALVAGRFARYISSVSVSDQARVALFDVESHLERQSDGTYRLTVTNRSEVTVSYRVLVEMDPHLQATVAGQTKRLAAGESLATFANTDWILAPNEAAELTVELAIFDWSGLTDPAAASGEAEQLSLAFAVKIAAEQVD